MSVTQVGDRHRLIAMPGSPKSWQASVTIVSVLVLGVCLPGCAYWESDEETVASQVKIFEDADVEVTSCAKVGEAITRYFETGASLTEAWRCDLDPPGAAPATESCYAVYNDVEAGVFNRLNCSLLGPGCPPGGRRLGDGSVFLGPIIHPDLVLERDLGNDPRHRTVRVDVSRDANGAPERCGYLDVQLPMDAEDPLELATERAKAHGWSEDRYSFAARQLGG